jgi:hypothetical protein
MLKIKKLINLSGILHFFGGDCKIDVQDKGGERTGNW